MWFRSHQTLSVRPLVRHSWISSIHSWSERLGCLWTILVQLLCCVLWVYWTSNTSLWTKLVQCLISLGLEWLSHELAGMERRWVIQRLHTKIRLRALSHTYLCLKRRTTHIIMRSSGKPDSPLTSPWFVVYRVPYKKNYKEKMSSGKHFHNVLCLREAKGMNIIMKTP